MDGPEPYKEFIREMTLRIERSLATFERAAEADRKVHIAHFEAIQDELRDLRSESRAVLQALLSVLDRLGGGGAAPAA